MTHDQLAAMWLEGMWWAWFRVMHKVLFGSPWTISKFNALQTTLHMTFISGQRLITGLDSKVYKLVLGLVAYRESGEVSISCNSSRSISGTYISDWRTCIDCRRWIATFVRTPKMPAKQPLLHQTTTQFQCLDRRIRWERQSVDIAHYQLTTNCLLNMPIYLTAASSRNLLGAATFDLPSKTSFL